MSPADSAGEPILNGTGGNPLGAVTLDMGGGPPVTDLGGISLEEQADGSAIIDLDPQSPLLGENPDDHDANLAKFMEPSARDALAAELIAAVEDDKSSRAEWESQLTKGIELLGTRIEDRTYPFKGACGVTDPLMIEAVLRFQAVARPELLPAAGPVKSQIIGVSTEAIEQQAYRVKEWMNFYLTEVAEEYYPDFDQMLFSLALMGSTFKAIYQDPILGRPVSPFVRPENLIVSYTASDIMTASRVTHVTQMSKRDVIMRQLRGIYINTTLMDPSDQPDNGMLKTASDQALGLSPVLAQGDGQYNIYDVHADIDLQGFEHRDESQAETGLPLPYRVTLDKDNVKTLSIRRNWRKDDPTFSKRQKFVHYKFMPGLGFYGFGFAHVLGGSAKTATMIRRQLIDAGTLNNFPGGLRVKGMRIDDNNITIGPTEFKEIDTAGMPIQNAVMTMPYKEPSQTSLELLRETYTGAKNLASTAEIAVGEGRQDAPVGTTVALMEASTRLQSAIMKRCHQSLRQELKIMAELFGEVLPDAPYPFPVQGGQAAIMKADFSQNVDVLPVSDPNITSSAQRVMRSEALVRIAQTAPQIHDVRETYREMYINMGLDDERINKILPPPPTVVPLDPLTENQNVLMNKPVKAGPMQNHDAHIAAHMALQELPPMMAHIQEHAALKMRVQVEQMLGIQLPPPGTPLPPEVENQIAVLVAQAMKVLESQNADGTPKPPTPEEIAMRGLDIEQMKAQAKVAETAVKDATERYKADLSYASDMLSLASKERIAKDKEQSARAMPPAWKH